MLRHKYLFLEIGANNIVTQKRVFKTREAGMRLMERKLINLDSEVATVLYRDARKHLQEFICTNGLVFIINRI